jgi:hypothetical protein
LECSICNTLKDVSGGCKFFDFLAAHRFVAGGWQAELRRSFGVGIVLEPVKIESAASMLKKN